VLAQEVDPRRRPIDDDPVGGQDQHRQHQRRGGDQAQLARQRPAEVGLEGGDADHGEPHAEHELRAGPEVTEVGLDRAALDQARDHEQQRADHERQPPARAGLAHRARRHDRGVEDLKQERARDHQERHRADRQLQGGLSIGRLGPMVVAGRRMG
jgi:hypothetical protein